MTYVNNPEAQSVAFDISTIPKISRAQAQLEVASKTKFFYHNNLFSTCDLGPTTLDTIQASVAPKAKASAAASAQPTLSAHETHSAYAAQLAAVPEFAAYGEILNSSAKPIPLTESETEYVVTCVKHIFKEHIVFQVSTDGLKGQKSHKFYSSMSPTPFQIRC